MYDLPDTENSQLALVSASRESEESCLPDVSASRDSEDLCLPAGASSPLSEHEVEDVVWISQTTSDTQPPECTANDLKQPSGEILEQDSSICVLPTVDQSEDGEEDGCSNISKVSQSPPPPPPIDVIAIDVTGQPLSDDVPRDVDEAQSNVDSEDCHSPLGGAMPESDDSSGNEFVLP